MEKNITYMTVSIHHSTLPLTEWMNAFNSSTTKKKKNNSLIMFVWLRIFNFNKKNHLIERQNEKEKEIQICQSITIEIDWPLNPNDDHDWNSTSTKWTKKKFKI